MKTADMCGSSLAWTGLALGSAIGLAVLGSACSDTLACAFGKLLELVLVP